jgi:hypothetical protein
VADWLELANILMCLDKTFVKSLDWIVHLGSINGNLAMLQEIIQQLCLLSWKYFIYAVRYSWLCCHGEWL